VARNVFAELTRWGLHAPFATVPRHRFLSSGDPTQFRLLGARFLGPEVLEVEHHSAARDRPVPVDAAVDADGDGQGRPDRLVPPRAPTAGEHRADESP
jgi:hypothetical protein